MVRARIAGVGMIPFAKPGQSEDWDVMAEKAIPLALADAGIGYELVQQAYAGFVYADSTAGQSAIKVAPPDRRMTWGRNTDRR